MSDGKRPIAWIQVLRGVAALGVVLTHARYVMFGTPQWPLAQELFLRGGMGVDLFFILSGFIMVLSTADSNGTTSYVLQFLVKRVARIWPVYAVITLIYVLSANGGFAYFQHSSNLVTLSKSLFFIPADYSQYFYFGVALPVGWSLEFEMYFYMVFGICLLFGKFRFAALLTWACVAVFVIPSATGVFTMNVLLPRTFPIDYFQLATNPIILEFVAGSFIGAAYLRMPTLVKSQKVAYNLLALSVSFPILILFSDMTHLHGPTQWGWPLAVMVLGMSIASKAIEIPAPKLLVWLGEISFSLYLTHMLSQFYAAKVFKFYGLGNYIQTWSYILFTTVFAIAVAAVSHHYLEEGLSEKVRKRLLRLFERRSVLATAEGLQNKVSL